MIPKILHYCFSFSPDSGDKPWSLIHYICLRSAVERIRPTEVLFYCEYEPSGPWWDLSRSMVTVEKIRAPREIFGNPLIHYAHRSDVVRLERLLGVGGIYLDADVFVHRSFDALLEGSVILAEQLGHGSVRGLCNAVILAEARAPFLQRWYSEYRSFRSRGRDAFWDEHSVQLPYELAKQFPHEVTILPPNAFFWPTCDSQGIARLFVSAEPLDVSCSYATHLWESMAWGRYLEYLTPQRVRAIDSTFHFWARPLIEGLPDNYGAPRLTARVAKHVRRQGRRVRGLIHRIRR